jgi:PPOX class probable F420-dependent enzyme
MAGIGPTGRHGSGGREGEGSPPARRLARPVPGRRLPLALPAARLAARTAPPGARGILEAPRRGSVEEIAACKRTLLLTFRRDGRGVPTPVWAAVAEGLLYVRTERSAGKVKRLANDPRLLVAPCTVRGRPLGAPLEAHGRLLESRVQERIAERVLAGRYGAGRALFEAAMDVMRVDMGYLEITPRAWD